MSIRPSTFAMCDLEQDGLYDAGRMGQIDIRPHSAWKNAQRRILHRGRKVRHLTDANMNVTALVLEDEEDVWIVVERYAYDAYGHTSVYDPDWESEEDTNYDNVILFAGYYRDPETWFYHVRNRFHHAELGRWHQRDPLGYAHGMSLYEYVSSAPVTAVDPMGLQKKTWNDCCPEFISCLVGIIRDLAAAGIQLGNLVGDFQQLHGATRLVLDSYRSANEQNAEASLWSLLWGGGERGHCPYPRPRSPRLAHPRCRA